MNAQALKIAEALQFSFDERLHLYRRPDGTEIPSVTQCLEAAGLCDVRGIPGHHLRRKGEIGTQTHRAADLLDEGIPFLELELDPAVAPYAKAYATFLAEHGPKWEAREERFIDEIDGFWFGGCRDRRGLLGKKRVAVDLKTSREPAKHWGVQLAGYTYKDRVARLALHLKPDATYKLIPQDNEIDYEAFRAALIIAWWKRK